MGRNMEVNGIRETFAVEAQAISQEVRRHDESELHMLGWNRQALAVYGPIIEAHGTPTQREIYRRHLLTADRLAKVNVREDAVFHAGIHGLAESRRRAAGGMTPRDFDGVARHQQSNSKGERHGTPAQSG